MLKSLKRDLGLFDAIENGDATAVSNLLKDGADPNIVEILSRVSAIHMAVGKNSEELICLLVHYGGDVNYSKTDTNSSPLGSAMLFGYSNIVNLLLRFGAKLSVDEFESGLIQEVHDLGFHQIANDVASFGIPGKIKGVGTL